MSIREPSKDPSIQKDNLQFLEHLKPGQEVGVDEKGRLYALSAKESKTEEAATKVFAETSTQIQNIAKEYAFETLTQKKFHHIEEGPIHYQEMIKKLSESHLLARQGLSDLATAWYGQRHADLIKAGYHPKYAEAVITIEMSHDPNIPEEKKQLFRPVPTSPNLLEGGIGGTYFIKDLHGEKIGVFKPEDEEPFTKNNPKEGFREDSPLFSAGGIRKGCIPGTGWQKEIAAYELDNLRGGIFGVPYTTKMEVPFPERRDKPNIIMKRGSFQVFVKGRPIDVLTKEGILDQIPKEQVQMLLVFDILNENTDRNELNLLYDEKEKKLHLIDNGSAWSIRADFKQAELEEIKSELVLIDLPQGNARLTRWQDRLPFGDKTQPILDKKVEEEIFRDDSDKYELLKKNGISDASIRVMKMRKIVLQECLKAGLTLNQIGEVLQRSSWADKALRDTRQLLEEHNKYENEELFFKTFRSLLNERMSDAKKFVENVEKLKAERKHK